MNDIIVGGGVALGAIKDALARGQVDLADPKLDTGRVIRVDDVEIDQEDAAGQLDPSWFEQDDETPSVSEGLLFDLALALVAGDAIVASPLAARAFDGRNLAEIERAIAIGCRRAA